jgi:hypothetical protein
MPTISNERYLKLDRKLRASPKPEEIFFDENEISFIASTPNVVTRHIPNVKYKYLRSLLLMLFFIDCDFPDMVWAKFQSGFVHEYPRLTLPKLPCLLGFRKQTPFPSAAVAGRLGVWRATPPAWR